MDFRAIIQQIRLTRPRVPEQRNVTQFALAIKGHM
jgi:hypothetical protein